MAARTNEVPGDAGYDPSVFARNQVIRNKTEAEAILELIKQVNDLNRRVKILEIKIGVKS